MKICVCTHKKIIKAKNSIDGPRNMAEIQRGCDNRYGHKSDYSKLQCTNEADYYTPKTGEWKCGGCEGMDMNKDVYAPRKDLFEYEKRREEYERKRYNTLFGKEERPIIEEFEQKRQEVAE